MYKTKITYESIVALLMTVKEYNSCVELFADRLFRYLVKQVKREADAQDAVQHAYEVLWKKRESLDFSKAKSYLFTVGRNHMIDNIRKVKRLTMVAELPEQGRNAEALNFELQETLNLGLAQLSELQRSLILLRDYEGYAYKEIAEIAKISESMVKVSIFRARKKLQKFLGSVEKASS